MLLYRRPFAVPQCEYRLDTCLECNIIARQVLRPVHRYSFVTDTRLATQRHSTVVVPRFPRDVRLDGRRTGRNSRSSTCCCVRSLFTVWGNSCVPVTPGCVFQSQPECGWLRLTSCQPTGQ